MIGSGLTPGAEFLPETKKINPYGWSAPILTSRTLNLQAQLVQAQKMESVGRLAGGVAHDYNNALSVIIGFTEMAIDDVDPNGPLRANLEEVLTAAKRATDITRQLLAFARKQTIAPKVLDLNQTVEGMFKMLRRLIGEDINLAWLPGEDLWPVKIDPSQIDQILANLCVNARDAIEDVGKITIETGTWPLTQILRRSHWFCSRRVCEAGRKRQRLRHGQGNTGQNIRTVFHHKGCGQGHRAGAGHGLRHR